MREHAIWLVAIVAAAVIVVIVVAVGVNIVVFHAATSEHVAPGSSRRRKPTRISRPRRKPTVMPGPRQRRAFSGVDVGVNIVPEPLLQERGPVPGTQGGQQVPALGVREAGPQGAELVAVHVGQHRRAELGDQLRVLAQQDRQEGGELVRLHALDHEQPLRVGQPVDELGHLLDAHGLEDRVAEPRGHPGLPVEPGAQQVVPVRRKGQRHDGIDAPPGVGQLHELDQLRRQIRKAGTAPSSAGAALAVLVAFAAGDACPLVVAVRLHDLVHGPNEHPTELLAPGHMLLLRRVPRLGRMQLAFELHKSILRLVARRLARGQRPLQSREHAVPCLPQDSRHDDAAEPARLPVRAHLLDALVEGDGEQHQQLAVDPGADAARAGAAFANVPASLLLVLALLVQDPLPPQGFLQRRRELLHAAIQESLQELLLVLGGRAHGGAQGRGAAPVAAAELLAHVAQIAVVQHRGQPALVLGQDRLLGALALRPARRPQPPPRARVAPREPGDELVRGLEHRVLGVRENRRRRRTRPYSTTTTTTTTRRRRSAVVTTVVAVVAAAFAVATFRRRLGLD